MIVAYKIRHNRDFTRELSLAMKVAKFAIANRDKLSSKYVKHLGLKSAISNAILYKYGRNRNCKKVSRVNLLVPTQSIRVRDKEIYIPCLELTVNTEFLPKFSKAYQVQIDAQYVQVAIEVKEKKAYKPKGFLGVDRNTVKHCAVAADTKSGKVMMLGKSAQSINLKYKNIRKNLQKKGKFIALKKIKNRESSKTKDLNHKISRKLVDYAYENKLEIKLENLTNIRKTRTNKSFRYSLHSWSYYQIQQFIEYKAKQLGVPIAYIAPQYTSKLCSRCGLLGSRLGKLFKCPNGHVAHADINAAFNIGNREVGDFDQKKMVKSGIPLPA